LEGKNVIEIHLVGVSVATKDTESEFNIAQQAGGVIEDHAIFKPLTVGWRSRPHFWRRAIATIIFILQSKRVFLAIYRGTYTLTVPAEPETPGLRKTC
jgi:hypothetical protein